MKQGDLRLKDIAETEQDRHPAPNAGLHDLTALGGEFQRRDNEAVRIRNEGPRAERALATRNGVAEIETAPGVGGLGDRGADMLRRAGAAGIDRVEVELEIVCQVARHHRTLQKVDVVQPVGDPSRVEEIRHSALAVAPPIGLDHVHRRTGRAVVHAGAGQVHVVARVAAEERDVPRRRCERVLDQRAGIAEPPIVSQRRASPGHDLDPRRRRIGQTDLLEHRQRRLVDARDVGF